MRPLVLTLALSACATLADKASDTDSTDTTSDTDAVDSDTLVVTNTDSDVVVETDDTDSTDATDDTDDTVVVDTDAAWSHTITVDGDVSDWTSSELFDTSAGTSAWISWDADNLYVALQHDAIRTGGAQHWVQVTVGGATPSSLEGPLLGSQQPNLVFAVARTVRWKVDESYHDLLSFTGSAWTVQTSGVTANGGAIAKNAANGIVEFRIPRSALGIADRADVHLHMAFEGAGFESSFAAVPSTSFVDGTYDPDFTAWYGFDLSSPKAPNATPVWSGTVDTDLNADTDPDTDVDSDTDGVMATDVDTDTDGIVATDSDVDTDTDGIVATDSDTDALPHTDSDAPPAPWSHALARPALADWRGDETFVTSQGAPTTTHITWDDTHIYLGATNPNVSTGGGEHWFVASFGTHTPGTLDGSQLGTQLPAMATPTTHLLRWKADNSYTDIGTWDGAAWVFDPTWTQRWDSLVTEDESQDRIAFAVPRRALGNPTLLDVTVRWVFEGAGFESTFAGTPHDAFVDGTYDPDIARSLTLDLRDPEGPGAAGLTDDPPDTDVPTEPWSHTLVVDGVDNDWLAEERFHTTSGGTSQTLISWDDDRLFVGSRDVNVTSGGSDHWFVVFLGTGANGSLVGPSLHTQAPVLATPANVVIRWKADDSYSELLTYNGATWSSDPGWRTTANAHLAESNSEGVVEWSIPWVALGQPSTFTVQTAWVHEGAGSETTFGGAPRQSFTEGSYNPGLARWYALDRSDATPPNGVPSSP